MSDPAWSVHTFADLVTSGLLLVSDGYRAKNEELGGQGPIFLRAGHVTDTHIDFSGIERFHVKLASKLTSKMSSPGDVVVTTKGNSTGRVTYVSPDLPPFVYSPHLSFWRSLDRNALVPGFLRYWSRGREFREQLAGLAGSTDMAPYLSLSDQQRLRITLPSPGIQKAIARILGSLDDLIELHRGMNETLEAIARAIFKSWFIDFDPVRAKADGRKPEGMDSSTASLFPDSFHTSELGEIPTGWTASKLASLTTKIGSGATPRGGSKVYLSQGIALIRSQNVYDNEFWWEGLARISDHAADDLKNVVVHNDDVLINITGDSILRTCVVDPSVLPARVNQHVAIIRAKEAIPPRFLHQFLVLQQTKDALLGFDSGGSRQAVTKGHLEDRFQFCYRTTAFSPDLPN